MTFYCKTLLTLFFTVPSIRQFSYKQEKNPIKEENPQVRNIAVATGKKKPVTY